MPVPVERPIRTRDMHIWLHIPLYSPCCWRHCEATRTNDKLNLNSFISKLHDTMHEGIMPER